jgi:hypothetical protein
VIPRLSAARRVKVDRWIISLVPFFAVINARVDVLKLGDPGVDVGPTFMGGDRFPDGRDRIRRGAVWWIKGHGNCGFHVDFHAEGIEIEAWTGKERRTTTCISGKVSEATLKRDLTVSLVAAGLTDLARTEEVRAELFTRTAKS